MGYGSICANLFIIYSNDIRVAIYFFHLIIHLLIRIPFFLLQDFQELTFALPADKKEYDEDHHRLYCEYTYF